MITIKETMQLLKKKYDEKVQESLEETDLLFKKFEVLWEIKNKNPKTDEDIRKAMGIGLCYNHLAFCCSVANKCIFRDGVLDAIGWDHDKFNEYKKGCIKLFQEMRKKE